MANDIAYCEFRREFLGLELNEYNLYDCQKEECFGCCENFNADD